MAMQLELPWRESDSLCEELERRTGMKVNLIITDNRWTMMSVRRARSGKSMDLRLHHMFLSADAKVIKSLAVWLKDPAAKPDADVVDKFINDNTHRIRSNGHRNNGFVTKGTIFDLGLIYRSLNREQFRNSITASITWGRMPPARRRRSIRFGSFYPTDNLIRIHPLLDQAFVPPYFTRYIVFHEMLHAYLGIEEEESGRRRYHTRDFVRMEEQYPDYERALQWQSDPANLRKLLR